ncbi:MAG: sulfatase-like hydrolase/transferase [Marinicellaceae bacterium]
MQQIKKNNFIYFIALWLPIIFSTPLIIAYQNPDDFSVNLLVLGFILAIFTIIISFFSYSLPHIVKFLNKKITYSTVVSLSIVLVLQGYIIHGFFDYGQLDGTEIEWMRFGWIFWFESVFFVVSIVILSYLLKKIFKHLVTFSYALILFALAQLVITIINSKTENQVHEESKTYDASVYEFSSKQNIIHILADGFQADIVKQVLDENPDLADEFYGFDFFKNHLGRFQGTSPTIPSIFNGQFFDLEKGYTHSKNIENLKKHSYTNLLYEAGFQLDFAPISPLHCHEEARNCDSFSFNDLKPKGYEVKTSIISRILLLLDVSLFRHTPMAIKQDIYNEGSWFFSLKHSTDLSSIPHPVISEWTEHMKVTTDRPVYKWYHFIGTHIPAFWDSNCHFIGRQPQERKAYLAQTECVLKGISSLVNKLKEENIFDKTTIIINGDHGCNIAANDMIGETSNSSLYNDKLFGTARPVFMIKPPSSNKPLTYNNSYTTLEDIAPTILESVGIEKYEFEGVSAFSKKANNNYKRYFHYYNDVTYWQGDPIDYSEYQITGDSLNRSNWNLKAIHTKSKAPSFYSHFSYENAFEFTKGMILQRQGDNEKSSSLVEGQDFFVLLSDIDSGSSFLNITLKVYHEKKDQSVSVYLNDFKVSASQNILANIEEWTTLQFSLPNDLLKSTNNLFRIKFSETENYTNKTPIKAKIKSIALK